MRVPSWRGFAVVSIAAVLSSVAVTVGASGPGISVQHSGNRVVWTADGSYQSATLTVAVPNRTVVERTFAANEGISFSPFDLEGMSKLDGFYSWQIVLSPVLDSKARELLESVRETDSRNTADALRERGKLPEDEELVFSGTFRFANRGLVSDNSAEPPSETAPLKGSSSPIDLDEETEDQVFVDDLIVIGSECVGQDCVNGENFGFDTLRLKENNLRIHFQDTSNSASFPTNDWRIVANDSSNGGGNYLAIEDSNAGRQVFRVNAGAPANSLFVSSGGDVGINTSTPAVELHVADGDSPALRLEQNGSSGFTPQTWDVAGNETNFFVRDVTNGSKLPFRIRPGAPSNSLYIDTDGDIGMGTASPDAKLHVMAATGGGAVDSIHLENNGPSRIKVSNTAITNSTTHDQDWILNSNGTFRISAGGDAAEFTLDADGNLTVTGSYLVNGTALTVPDFVFDHGYPLMPLGDLQEFVKTNHHLPSIPSATDVQSGVLDITRFQLQLLQKIEELTLYTLQQEETIDRLHGRIETLEDSVR